MKKILLQGDKDITLQEAFENFEKYNIAKSLAKETSIDYERSVNFFR